MDKKKDFSNNNNSILQKTKKSAIVSHLKKTSIQQKLEKPINQKSKNQELFQKIVKRYVLFFEFSIMKTAVKEMKKKKWKKFYMNLKFLCPKRIQWKIFCSDIYLSKRVQKFKKERKKLTISKFFLSYCYKERKLRFQKEFHVYLMKKNFKKWKNELEMKKKIDKIIVKSITECSNCYFLDLSIKSAVKIQRWFRDVQFYTKLEKIYDLENPSQKETENKFKFGSFNFIINENMEIPRFINNSSNYDFYENEINEISEIFMNETSKELLLNDLIFYKESAKLPEYKFLEDQKSVENLIENPSKNFFTRSKKNEVINSQLKPIKLKIGCSFKKLMYVKESIQSLLNFVISPDIKSPNDVLIIERTQTFEVPKEPKYVFYQRRYRTPLPEYENSNINFTKSFTKSIQKKPSIQKQIFYSPKKINANKVDQYNQEKNEKGIAASVMTLGEFLVSNLNVEIPLRFSDLLTEEKLNIHEFEISYDPVMKQGIDDEIDIIFKNVTFVPHLTFRKFIQKNIENSTYFLKFFRYIPYHLSKHQKRKLTEIVEPLLYSIMFGNISTVLSAKLCYSKVNDIYKRDQKSFYFQKHHRGIVVNNKQNKTSYLKKNKSHHQNSYSSEFTSEVFESEISGDLISDIEMNQSSPYFESYLNINETDKVFFCDESQISSNDNEFLINDDYQSLKFKKKKEK